MEMIKIFIYNDLLESIIGIIKVKKKKNVKNFKNCKKKF